MLNLLMREGCHVYHDLDGRYGNIDHLVVGPGGVFAVETKARRKPSTKNRRKDARVVYDGSRIRFPNYTDAGSLEQACRNAKWVSSWLTDSTGMPVRVQPVVALPGWFVEAKARSKVLVVNPKQNLTSIMARPGEYGSLSKDEIQRITYQIERENRTVEASSKKFDVEKH